MSPHVRKLLLVLMIGLALLPGGGCKSRRGGGAKKAAASFATWQEYKAPDGTFTVSLPVAPVIDRQSLRNRERIAYSSKSASEYYRVTVYLTPDNARAQKNAANAKWLEPYADTWSKSNHKEVKVGSMSGLDVTWSDAKFKYRGRVLGSPDGHVVYMLRARWTTGAEPANVQPFLDSFKAGTYTPPAASSSPAGAVPGAENSPGVGASPAGSASPAASSAPASPSASASSGPVFEEDDAPSPEADKIDVKDSEEDDDE